MVQWKEFGQISLNHLEEFEIRVWKPHDKLAGWYWSCETLHLKRQHIAIVDEKTATKEVLKLVLDKIDAFCIMLVEAQEELETVLLNS